MSTEFLRPPHFATTRRRTIGHLGLAMPALGLGLLGTVAGPRAALALCEPPGTPGTPQALRRDCRTIRPRRPASTLSAGEIQKLKDAYQAMRALDTSDPNDPRGFRHQANVHCWYCGEGTQIHFSWQFFAWHRAYLYFHERILGKLVGDPEFRLPYWDWDVATHRRLPGAYTSPNDNTNPLWNSTRGMSPTDELPEEDVGAIVMDAALTAPNFTEFGGSAVDNGIPEGSPHGSVHVDVGGDMGFFDFAAKDPIFYAHHSNVDKMWSDWIKADATHTNPAVAAFLDLAWNFYDENKVWRRITAAQILNHESQLRYTYGPSLLIEKLLCLIWVVLRTDWKQANALRIPVEARRRMLQATEKSGAAKLHIAGLQVPLRKSAMYRLYANADAAKADRGPGADGYLGTFPVVLNDRQGKHVHRRTRNITLMLSRKVLDALPPAPATLQLAFVERDEKGAQKTVLPVRAADVWFSVGELQA